MAWAGIIIGTCAGLAAALYAGLVAGFPFWLCLTIHTAAGTTVALATIAALFLLRGGFGGSSTPAAAARTARG